MIEKIATNIDERFSSVSGKVFYSGRAAFSKKGGIYVLGYNPGGDPATHEAETVRAHTQFVLNSAPDDWSAYRDETWQGTSRTMQRRMLHLFSALQVNPGHVPSSNLVFTRSKRIADLSLDKNDLIEMCWPVHAEVLRSLTPKAIICLGGDCANEVRKRVSAHEKVGSFIERNNRRWESVAWRSKNGTIVFNLSHPSYMPWTNANSDPSQMVRDVLLRG